MPARLQITADDLGASAAVNAAIARSHRSGILTTASLMVTGGAVTEAVALAGALPSLSVGLHLVLVDGRAASPPAAIPDLADGAGRFPGDAARAGLTLWWRRRRLRAQLETEIRAQLDAYRATGLPLAHVDSHHHLHMHPVVWSVLCPLLVEYGVPWVRIMDEDARGRCAGRAPLDELHAGVFRLLSLRVRSGARRSGLGAADRVYGLRATERLDEAELVRLLGALPDGTFEIFAHPREDTPAGRREEAALTAPGVAEALARAGHRALGSRALGISRPGPAASGT